jgi:MoaA/NifB/PqqE/SkfB family radical SAM enzyme
MSIKSKIAEYKRYRHGVCHCTFNPGGPGVVRIHLVPPKFRLFGGGVHVVILNGYYILPIGSSWAAILAEFIGEVKPFDGKSLSKEDYNGIYERTVKRVAGLYRGVSRDEIESDLYEMLDAIFTVAHGGSPGVGIEHLSIRKYAKHMSAPHRMDLMVSAMTDEKGQWKCNQKCTFCYAAGQKMSSSKELGTNEWKKILDKLWESRVPMVTFTGGEPTQREDIVKLVRHAEKFVTRLNTNGINVTEKLARELAGAGLDSMQVTLYSYDAKIHNELVGAERFNDTVEGIKNALAAGLDVSINTPLCKKNSDYIKTLEFAHALGVRFVTASGLILTGMADINHKEYDLDKKELTDIVIGAKKFTDRNDMEIDFTSPGLIDSDVLENMGMNVPMCGACISNMAIAPDGSVVPCQSWLGADASLGNLLTDDFKLIWNNPKCLSLRFMSEDEALACPFRTGKR